MTAPEHGKDGSHQGHPRTSNGLILKPRRPWEGLTCHTDEVDLIGLQRCLPEPFPSVERRGSLETEVGRGKGFRISMRKGLEEKKAASVFLEYNHTQIKDYAPDYIFDWDLNETPFLQGPSF